MIKIKDPGVKVILSKVFIYPPSVLRRGSKRSDALDKAYSDLACEISENNNALDRVFEHKTMDVTNVKSPRYTIKDSDYGKGFKYEPLLKALVHAALRLKHGELDPKNPELFEEIPQEKKEEQKDNTKKEVIKPTIRTSQLEDEIRRQLTSLRNATFGFETVTTSSEITVTPDVSNTDSIEEEESITISEDEEEDEEFEGDEDINMSKRDTENMVFSSIDGKSYRFSKKLRRDYYDYLYYYQSILENVNYT